MPRVAPAAALAESPAVRSPTTEHVEPPPAAASTVPTFLIEGVHVHLEHHGVVGQPNHYSRLIANCPHHRQPDASLRRQRAKRPKVCRVTRCFDTKAGLKSNLGDLEPHAFVGCWLANAPAFSSADEHAAWKPSPAEVRNYAVAQGWA